MPKMTLMQSQKNVILGYIEVHELDPFNFRWKEVSSGPDISVLISRLEYADTGYYFQFDIYEGQYISFYSPGEDALQDSDRVSSWDLQCDNVYQWLSYLKRELDAPDLWGQFAKYQLPKDTTMDGDTSNESFTVPEFEQIKIGISKIRDYIARENLASGEQVNTVNAKLDYLVESARRQGRRDWFNIAIGSLVTIAVQLSIPSGKLQTIWGFLKAALMGAVHFLKQ